MAGERNRAHSRDAAGGEDQRKTERAGSDGEVAADPRKRKKSSHVESPSVEPVSRSVRRKKENGQADSPGEDLGSEYCDAGASKAHGGEAEASIDQEVVENEVESIDDEGDHHRRSGILDASEKSYGGEEEKGKGGSGDPDTKVSCALRQYLRLGAH